MANGDLSSFIERALNFHREKTQVEEMIAELKQEVGSAGFDKAAFDAVVKRLLLDEEKARKAKAKEEAIRMMADHIGQADLFG